MRAPRSILITGASRGLGAALAVRLAGPGVALALLARGAEGLAATAAACVARGAVVRSAVLDVADTAAVAAQVAAWDEAAAFDCVIANAGGSVGTAPDGTPEPFDETLRVVATNLAGAVATVGPLLPRFRARRAGHVVLISSVSAFRGTPDFAGYAASKAGLRAWGEALRPGLARQGVALTVVCPGFFASAMSARWVGAKPLAVDLETASARVHRAILRRARRCTFPWGLAALLRVLDLLPAGAGDAAIRVFRARIVPEGALPPRPPAGN